MNAIHMPGLDAHLNRGGPMDDIEPPDADVEFKAMQKMTTTELVALHIEFLGDAALRQLLLEENDIPELMAAKRVQAANDDAAANAADYHD